MSLFRSHWTDRIPTLALRGVFAASALVGGLMLLNRVMRTASSLSSSGRSHSRRSRGSHSSRQLTKSHKPVRNGVTKHSTSAASNHQRA